MQDLRSRIEREKYERLEEPSRAEIDACLQRLVEQGRVVRIEGEGEGEGEPIYFAVCDN